MFAIIETTYNSENVKIEVEQVAEFPTFEKANRHMERMIENGMGEPDDNGVYCTYHVESL
ncbi:hypothetical protein PP939_gp145 [Rhizobium phage RL38J1]|uniref:Uncharacterized protein n=1 Tax=Rhizobium phage RL38J1 TaxID=2663232 RepID=A0A6B9J749_9CAUD|nr:hypothetical protein PP939_gp145 [Rhizobium phage RL38J1]QGZ14081.1 hypothetical protein RL38J1_145 [Rhizobium phage RL38J1]